ncbi:MAG: hypothetical protein H6834_17660 [Planctomycetes bacterium]|nr:hypothetical protein [Planctomycetota bacterium]
MTRLRDTLRLSSPYQVVALVSIALQVGTIAWLARLLSVAHYDDWLLGQAIFALCHATTLPGVVPWIVRGRHAGPFTGFFPLWRTGRLVLLAQAVLVGTAVSCWSIARPTEASRVATWCGWSTLFEIGRQGMMAHALGEGRHVRVSALELLFECVRAGCAAGGAWLLASASGAAACVFLGQCALGLGCHAWLVASERRAKVRPGRPPLRAVLGATFPLAVSKNVTALGRDVLPVLCLQGTSAGTLATYRTTWRILDLPLRILPGVFKALLGGRTQLEEPVLRRFGRTLGLALTGAVCGLGIAAPYLVAWLLDREVVVDPALCLALAGSTFFLGLGFGLDIAYLGRGRTGRQAIVNLAWFLATAPFTIWCATTYEARGAGVAVLVFSMGTALHWWRLARTRTKAKRGDEPLGAGRWS